MTSGTFLLAAPRASRLALAGLLLSLTTVVFIVALDALFLAAGRPMEAVFSLVPLVLIIDLSGVGGLLIIRRPDNRIGLVLFVAGLLTAVTWGGGYYIDLDDFVGGWLPFIVPLAWLTGWIFPPAIGLMAVVVPMLYPSGHLPGPRWRVVAAFALVAISLNALAAATKPGPMSNFDTLINPVVLAQPVSDLIQALGALSFLTAPPVVLIIWANLAARFLRSRGIERQQMKWFLSVATVAAFALAASIVTSGPISDAFWILTMLSMGLLPVAIGIAILRYRLYDIDRLLSRTVSYGVITAVLVVLFLGINLALQEVLANYVHANTLAVAGSTLAAFAVFQPLRRRVQAAVDRRFDRRRYEADRTVAVFAERLRDEVDPAHVRLELDRVLAGTLAPRATGLWLRGEHEAQP